MVSPESKQFISRGLCRAVREATLEELQSGAANHGLKVEQAWRASSGEGFKAAAARLMVDAEDILVVAFRSTIGNDEWLEYPQKYWKRTFLPRDGEPAGTDLKVFTVWAETLNEIWDSLGDAIDGYTDTLRGMIWRQLNAGNRVWLAGHSKGGAVAATAASRLLLGDAVGDAALPNPALRRPEDRQLTIRYGPLSKLSVFTFNAPKSFSVPLAEAYEARLAEVGAEHVRVEHRADRVRKLPPLAEMKHVGVSQLIGEGVLEDTGVVVGAAIAIGGVAAALIAMAAKVANSH